MRWWLLGASFLLLACGNPADPPASTSQSTVAAGDSCAEIARRYVDALSSAMVCDPSAASPCGAERPIAVGEQSADGSSRLTGLCDASSAGYVNPASTQQLDALLAEYAAAGCVVGSCPSPSPHPPACVTSTAGFTCH